MTLTSEWRLVPASEFGRHLQAWDRVAAGSRSSPLNEAAFIGALLRVFGRGDEVLAICGDPIAPHAMCVLRPSGAGVWEAFQASQGPLSAWVHRSGLSYEDLLPSLVKALPGMPLVVSITQKDPDIHSRPKDSSKLKTLDYVQTARVVVNRPFEDYWQARDKKVKYEIRRRLKRLSEIGIEPRLELLRDPGEVAAAVEAYGSIEGSGWKGEAGTAVHGDNEQGLFYRIVLSDYCARGKGRIYRYWFGDQVVAMQMCIEDARTLVFLKTAYDERHARYAPGILMKYAIFEQAFREGKLERIEFYGALLEWQRKWIDEVRTMYHVTYYRWTWLPNMQELRRAAARAIDVVQHSGKAAAGAVGRTAGRFRNRADAFGEAIRRLGWLNGCLFAFDWLLVAVSAGGARLHKYYFMAQPVADRRWLPLKRGADIEIRRVAETDPVIRAFPRPGQTILCRFSQGAICLAALKAGRWIGFLWLTLGPYREDEVRCRYVPLPAGNAAWDFDVHLEPEHRNGVAFLKLWDEANSFLAAHKVRWSLSRISAFNRGSILSHARMGAKRIGAVTFLSIGSWQISAATVPPYLHFSAHPDSFPSFALDPEQTRGDEPVG